jgi:histidine kinase
MRDRLRRLDVRLFLSYALVVLGVAVVLALTLVIVAPKLFDEELRSAVGAGGGHDEESHQAFTGAMESALPIALLVSLAAAGVAAAFMTRRIVRPINAVREATRRLADGHYDERVTAPAEPELAALADDVNHLAGALETTERRRAELIGEVAHEMRTPLTTIDGYVEGILDGVFEPSEEVLTAVGEETARLRRLATDLATLSRTEEGAVDLHASSVDLGKIAAGVAERLRAQFDDKGVGLDVTSGPEMQVDVDPDRLSQVLTNLIGNALTYTPKGGRVTVTATRVNGDATVAVTDTGIGLSAEDLELVFDRFYRVRGPVRPHGGSGIGLTIARGLARAHEGDIEASSPGPGRGATFTLHVPAA